MEAPTAARGEIIGGLVLALLGWMYHRYRVFMKTYKLKKKELERLQEALRQAEAQKAEEAKSREETERQLKLNGRN